MSRNPLLVVLGGTFASVFLAAAATLVIQGGVLQAGGEHDLICDEDGVTVTFKSDESTGLKIGARIEGIDDDCRGASLKFDTSSPEDGGPFFVGSIGAPSYTFLFSSPLPADSVEEFTVVIFGSDSEVPNQND